MVAARLQEQHGMFRLFGCLVVQLFGCSAVQLLGRSAESVGRPRDGSTSPEMPVAFRRFCPESGSDSLSGPAFRTSFPDQLSGPVSGLASGPASRFASGLAFGFAFRVCFRICFAICFRTCFRAGFPDAGAILFDCGMRRVVPIRPQDSSAQFFAQQLPAAGV